MLYGYEYAEIMLIIHDRLAQAEADHQANLVTPSLATSVLNQLGLVLERVGERMCALAGRREEEKVYLNSFIHAHQP